MEDRVCNRCGVVQTTCVCPSPSSTRHWHDVMFESARRQTLQNFARSKNTRVDVVTMTILVAIRTATQVASNRSFVALALFPIRYRCGSLNPGEIFDFEGSRVTSETPSNNSFSRVLRVLPSATPFFNHVLEKFESAPTAAASLFFSATTATVSNDGEWTSR